PLNPASALPAQASHLYARNIASFLDILIKDGKLELDEKDELVRGTLVLRGGLAAEPAAAQGANK
ncbi:MAG: NAD(P)(+) transhydrogenase (Re/Si-specific) subunit alpha, partial [Elusimicrobia bacterium]|nr:NAD(P)(+) transhydrogenase (Re/Si-specific) subunit alpha [Elusimicrobiota bacterium]